MTLDARFPTLGDMRPAALRRIPRYLRGYLDGGAGSGAAQRRSAEALDATLLMPGLLAGPPTADLSTRFLGQTYDRPFGIAPVGMGGAVWPDAEGILAREAARSGIPFCLSTVAASPPEEIGPHVENRGWFQLYAPADPDVRRDILRRAKAAGFTTLVFTIDVPELSRRPREMRERLENPMRVTPRIVLQSALCPAWALGMLGKPLPRPRLFEPYEAGHSRRPGDKHIGITFRTVPDRPYLETLRSEWDGPLVVKGVLDPADVGWLVAAGADALWVTNHGGRQFEAAPAPATVLPAIRDAAGPDLPLICDGAVRSGTDVLRLLALGADFVMLGRAFFWGLGAAGAAGAAHVVHVLSEEIRIDMAQLAINTPHEARKRLFVGHKRAGTE